MNPVAFSIASIEIRWYGILIGLGIIFGILIANYNSRFRNVSVDTLLDFVLIGLPFGIIGARLYYVIFNFSMYKDNFKSIFYIREGGLAIHGGLIAAILAVYLYARHKKVNIFRYLDVAAPSIILAQALGRWGNFFNSEAHGSEVSKQFISKFPSFIQKGMYIDNTYYHPTFLYESTWNILVFIIILLILIKSKKLGIVFFSYIGLYSVGRFFIEGLRTDSLYFGPIRTAQFVSCLGILIAIIYFVFLRTGKIKNYE